MYVNKCIKCGAEFETKNPKRVICPNCLYADKGSDSSEEKPLQSYSSYSADTRQKSYDRPQHGGYRNNKVMAEYIRIHPDNPQEKAIDQVVKILKDGGLIIYPSDTVYGLGCDITNLKAMEKLARLKGVKLEKTHFSIICNDLSHLSNYTLPIDNSTFKILKRALPGPFTFVMNASRNLPSAYKGKKTVGIRVPEVLLKIL